jgi:hypothetical protein
LVELNCSTLPDDVGGKPLVDAKLAGSSGIDESTTDVRLDYGVTHESTHP